MRDRDGMDSNYVPQGMDRVTQANEIAQLKAEKHLLLNQLYGLQGDSTIKRGFDNWVECWDAQYSI